MHASLRSNCPRIKLAYLVPGRCNTFLREFLSSPMSSHDHEHFLWRRSNIASGNNCSWHDQHLVLLGASSPAVSVKSLSDCKRLVLTSIFICFRTGWDDMFICADSINHFTMVLNKWQTLPIDHAKFKCLQELISKYSSCHRNHMIWLLSDDHGILVHMHHGIFSQSMYHSDVKNSFDLSAFIRDIFQSHAFEATQNSAFLLIVVNVFTGSWTINFWMTIRSHPASGLFFKEILLCDLEVFTKSSTER